MYHYCFATVALGFVNGLTSKQTTQPHMITEEDTKLDIQISDQVRPVHVDDHADLLSLNIIDFHVIALVAYIASILTLMLVHSPPPDLVFQRHKLHWDTQDSVLIPDTYMVFNRVDGRLTLLALCAASCAIHVLMIIGWFSKRLRSLFFPRNGVNTLMAAFETIQIAFYFLIVGKWSGIVATDASLFVFGIGAVRAFAGFAFESVQKISGGPPRVHWWIVGDTWLFVTLWFVILTQLFTIGVPSPPFALYFWVVILFLIDCAYLLWTAWYLTALNNRPDRYRSGAILAQLLFRAVVIIGGITMPHW